MAARAKLAVVFGAGVMALVPAVAFAHGLANPAPTPWRLLTRWDIDPLFLLGLGPSGWLYLAGVRRVNARHPVSPWPRRRTLFFFAGLVVLTLAITSPLAVYDNDLFWVHMWQHLLITMVAAPLMLLGTPLTLGLRAASPGMRKQLLLPILHSGLVRVISFPVLPWILFTVVMWGSHFSPLYNDALEHPWVHRAEHAAYLAAALLFWWEVIGIDPTPWRMHHAVRALFVFLQMPLSSFLAVSIYSTDHVLYPHYETLVRTWGPSPLLDQQIAGVSMWIGGDVLFLFSLGLIIAAWVRQEEREARRDDARRDLARARAMSAEQSPGPQSG